MVINAKHRKLINKRAKALRVLRETVIDYLDGGSTKNDIDAAKLVAVELGVAQKTVDNVVTFEMERLHGLD